MLDYQNGLMRVILKGIVGIEKRQIKEILEIFMFRD